MNLDWNLIADVLGDVRDKLRCHVVVESISSTNDWAEWSCGSNRLPAVCLAEQQISGRGRNNRKWVSPAGENIYLSLVYPFTVDNVDGLNGLSLVVGVAIARVLKLLEIADVKLKWPNDVLVAGLKIAGVLIETKISQNAPFKVIIGVGINYSLSDASRQEISAPCIDVVTAINGDQCPDRNYLAGEIIKELMHSCEVFQRHGFAAFIDEWHQYDACCNREVNVHDSSGMWTGKVIGLNQHCGLRVLRDNTESVVYAADVSIRIK